MPSPTIEQQLLAVLEHLPPDQQRQVLDYARTLAAPHPPGIPGHTLLAFAGTIPPDDLAEIAAAIESGCEQIDRDEW